MGVDFIRLRAFHLLNNRRRKKSAQQRVKPGLHCFPKRHADALRYNVSAVSEAACRGSAKRLTDAQRGGMPRFCAAAYSSFNSIKKEALHSVSFGGPNRIRTGVNGFADRYLTTRTWNHYLRIPVSVLHCKISANFPTVQIFSQLFLIFLILSLQAIIYQ